MVIELLPLDPSEGGFLDQRGRPPPAGIGTVPSTSEVLSRLIGRALDTPDPPLVRAPTTAAAWPDLRVHRLVRLPPLDAARGLHAALVARAGSGPDHRPTTDLEVLGGHSARGLVAALHVRRHGPGTPVELVLEPWSEYRTDLCLQLRRRPGRTGAHLPRRYFDVAHRVMDDLWHQIEAAAAA